jgi:transposase
LRAVFPKPTGPVELVWLTGRLMPDFKTIADFRKNNGGAIREVCREFVVLRRRLELFCEAGVAIDGSKFSALRWQSQADRCAGPFQRKTR